MVTRKTVESYTKDGRIASMIEEQDSFSNISQNLRHLERDCLHGFRFLAWLTKIHRAAVLGVRLSSIVSDRVGSLRSVAPAPARIAFPSRVSCPSALAPRSRQPTA